MTAMPTALVISARAADFVWRCGGAIALHAARGYDVTVLCLSFGESARLWKEGKTLQQVKDIRRAEAERAGEALGVHELVCLDMAGATDQREDILRAADIFLENGVFIETGPHKHAIQGTFFLYVYEPAGNRVEVANAGARLILDPDWEPITWTEAERRKGQAWGLKTIESFHTHGTPPIDE